MRLDKAELYNLKKGKDEQDNIQRKYKNRYK